MSDLRDTGNSPLTELCHQAVKNGDRTVPCALVKGHPGPHHPAKLDAVNGLIVPLVKA